MAGRPSYKPTAATRRKVSIAAGGGMSHEHIAIALGISRNTLEKHFEHELSVGAFERRLEVLQGVYAAAKKGNVAAAKLYAGAGMELAAPPAASVPTGPAKGKKETANDVAKTVQVGTGWEGLLPGAAPVQ